jgi:hypothetical protein
MPVLGHPSFFNFPHSSSPSPSSCLVYLQPLQLLCTSSVQTGELSSSCPHRTTRRSCSTPSTSTAAVNSSHMPTSMPSNVRKRSNTHHLKRLETRVPVSPSYQRATTTRTTLHLQRPRQRRRIGRCQTRKSSIVRPQANHLSRQQTCR